MALRSTQPLTEMSARNLPGGKVRPARKADNLTAVSRISGKCGSLDTSQSYGPPRPITGIASPIFYFTFRVSDGYAILDILNMMQPSSQTIQNGIINMIIMHMSQFVFILQNRNHDIFQA
jgi:hypothetical protein